MSTEYLAVNKDTNEAYNLGKGFWDEIADMDKIIHTGNRDILLLNVKKAIEDFAIPDTEKHDYAVEITDFLISVGDMLVLKTDMFDEDLSIYKIIGTRYK